MKPVFRSWSAAMFLLLSGFLQTAWGTDTITCDSKTFNVSFAVGSYGDVSGVTLADKSGRYFSRPIEIIDMKKGHSHASIPNRSVDIQAVLPAPPSGTMVILMKKGKGYIKVKSRREHVRCDWVI